jgi:hypothetical protein
VRAPVAGALIAAHGLLFCGPAACDRTAASVELSWVSPERCLTPCTFEPSTTLVEVDAQARVTAAAGQYRIQRDAQPPLAHWLAAATRAGHRVEISSAYRSYTDQINTYMAAFDTKQAARPGHSEHQLGSAVDLRYDSSAAESWLASTAPSYGFVQSYPKGKEALTGYRAEPWHYRHVGRAIAEQLAQHGLSLEEYFRDGGAFRPGGLCDQCPSPLSRAL